MRQTVFFLLLSMLTGTSYESAADEECSKKAHAVSKEMYDLIVHGTRTGVTLDDVEPTNLTFDSESLGNCLENARLFVEEQDERQIAYLMCWKRHPPPQLCPEDE